MSNLSDTSKALITIVVCLAVALAISNFFFSGRAVTDEEKTFWEEFGLVLQDYEGNQVQLSEFRRKVLIVYAWASWCPYCGDELKNLVQLKQRYGNDVYVVAVNRAEPLPVAKAYTDALNLGQDLVVLLDPNDALYKSVGGYAMPETVFIDELGNITFHQRGPIELAAVEAKIQEILQ